MTERVDLEELERRIRPATSVIGARVTLPVADLNALVAELTELRASAAEVARLRAELADLKSRLHQHEGRYDTEGLLRNEPAPAAKCASFEGDWSDLAGTDMRAPLSAPAVSEEQLAAGLLREVAFINLDTYPSELRDKLADIQRRIAARGMR